MNLLTVFFQAPAAGPDGSLMWIHADSNVCYHVFLHDSSAEQEAERDR